MELYRTRMAGRRSLILLDDAATEQQIRPLLPCTVGCVVVVTSRSPLGGLAGRVLTELSVLPEEESVELLVRLIGEQRAAAEDRATSRIVRQCGGLPLAIRVAGARLADRQRWPLHAAGRPARRRAAPLDELAVGDQEVRASIGLSYRGLEAGEAAVLRVLGLLGLPEFPAWVAAIALELSEEEAEQAIERLMDAQADQYVQVDCTGHLRYRLHDLVRLYARERAEAEQPEPELRELVSRVTTSWLWLIDAVRRGAKPTGPPPAGVGPALDDLIERVLDRARAAGSPRNTTRWSGRWRSLPSGDWTNRPATWPRCFPPSHTRPRAGSRAGRVPATWHWPRPAEAATGTARPSCSPASASSAAPRTGRRVGAVPDPGAGGVPRGRAPARGGAHPDRARSDVPGPVPVR